MGSLMIGRLAKLAKVGVETIRFYEREGLIDEPPRKESGYRQSPKRPFYEFGLSNAPRNLVSLLKKFGDFFPFALILRLHARTFENGPRPRYRT